MSRRASVRLAWTLWTLSVAFAGFGAWFLLLYGRGNRSHRPTQDAIAVLYVSPGSFQFGYLALVLANATVGALIAARRPANPIGWLFCASGLVGGLGWYTTGYAAYGLVTRPSSLPGADVAAWLSSWLLGPAPFALLAFGLLLFPTGRAPSARWRPVGWLAGLAAALSSLAILKPGPLENPALPLTVANPFGIAGAGAMLSVAEGVGFVLMMVAIVASLAAWLLRLRRARGDERQQLKWVAYAGAMSVAVLVAAPATWVMPPVVPRVIWPVLFLIAGLAIPISVAIAILRHRLFDIDLLINRTLVYGVLTAGLALVYAGGVVVFQGLLGPLTGGSDLAIAGSTLAVAAVARPARNRVQATVDRRFYRHKYDAARTIEAFRARMRDEVDLDALGAELRAVVQQTMQPAHVSLWLREARPAAAPLRREAGSP